MWGGLRRRASVDYGLTGAIGVGLPLIVGSLLGAFTEGAWVGLGAYLLALVAPKGPYSLPARRMWASFGVIVAGACLGVLVAAGGLWWSVPVVPSVAAIGAVLPWIGITGPLTVLVAATQPHGADLTNFVPAVAAGALWMLLLMLLPFRWRVQKQLRNSVSEAARAVAELLEAPRTDEALRTKASESFTEARQALELTRPTERGLRRERLIDALVRVLHAAVTLHGLLHGMKDPPPEVHEAVVFQAARLRVLADAIEHSLHLPPAETHTLDRLAERIDELRAEWRTRHDAGEGAEELYLRLLVLEQILRLVRRVGAAVESAARLAGKLTFERAGPALPGAPHPLRGWRTAVRHVGDRSPTFRYATRLFFTTAVALAVVAALRPPYGNWLAISAMVTTRATYGETLERARARIIGVLAGGVLAALVLQLVHDKFLLALVVCGFALLAFGFRGLGQTTWVLFVTPTMMTLVDFAAPLGWEVAALRVVLTVAGVAIGLAAGRLLWPRGGLRIDDRVRAVRRAHAALVRAMAEVLDREKGDYEAAYKEARATSAELVKARNRLAAEPTPDTERIAALKRVLDTAQRVRDDMVTLRGLLPEETVDPGPIPELLDLVADTLEEGGRCDAAAELDQLDAHLSQLARARRAEVRSGEPGDTPLRRDLLHAAAVRSALRRLTSESFGDRDEDEVDAETAR
ncbi:putative membrane protein YccC [Actinocorallia herbida]|uniref:Putative membrane protein YccC n=1 Tax=Actinocorallia herbida TaxID=58109 RepID=A0A3N1DBQ1_9ACTN|nr:FUSC family protein [Actinocorallia herbida]ROO90952.1 putative membrane protein YccC [Actinocorallia herbida]